MTRESTKNPTSLSQRTTRNTRLWIRVKHPQKEIRLLLAEGTGNCFWLMNRCCLTESFTRSTAFPIFRLPMNFSTSLTSITRLVAKVAPHTGLIIPRSLVTYRPTSICISSNQYRMFKRYSSYLLPKHDITTTFLSSNLRKDFFKRGKRGATNDSTFHFIKFYV